jgi:predicted AAA+ superfamily ATPase
VKMDEYKWYNHYSYLLKQDNIFETFFPGRAATNQGHGLHNDVIVITGKKGVGKTELAKFLMYLFSENEKEDKFVVFCGIPDLYSDMEEVLGKRFLQVDLEEIEIEGYFDVPSITYFENMFVLFDDTEKHECKDIEKMLWRMVNVLAQKGRNFRVTLLCILHQINKGISSTTILREMDAMIIFPKFFDMNTYNTINNHIGIPKNITDALYKLDERFILVRNSAPQYFFLGTSMIKTCNFNVILKQAYGDMEGGFEEGDEEADINELLGTLKIDANGETEFKQPGESSCETCNKAEENRPEDIGGRFDKL